MNCLQFGGECNPQCCKYPCNTLRGYNIGRTKAINEFVEKYTEMVIEKFGCDCITDENFVYKIAEQLKEN